MKRFTVFALAVTTICVAAAAAAAEHKGLEGTSWKLLALGPNGAIEGDEPTLSFSPDGKVSGSGGCNTYSGTATVSGDAIKFSTMTGTKKACSEQVDAQEKSFLKALDQAQTFENRATSLLINTKAFAEPLSFVPKM